MILLVHRPKIYSLQCSNTVFSLFCFFLLFLFFVFLLFLIYNSCIHQLSWLCLRKPVRIQQQTGNKTGQPRSDRWVPAVERFGGTAVVVLHLRLLLPSTLIFPWLHSLSSRACYSRTIVQLPLQFKQYASTAAAVTVAY